MKICDRTFGPVLRGRNADLKIIFYHVNFGFTVKESTVIVVCQLHR